jgi:hypothetical protein
MDRNGKKYLIEWMGLDLRELVFHVIGVHRPDLIPSRRSQDFDDFHQLIDAGFAWEERLAQHKLSHDAARGPNVYTFR